MPELPLVQQPVHPLFGGAITMKISETFRDTSVIQPLADTREQFYSPENRVTLVIDIMIMLEKDIKESLNTYLRDIDVCSDSQTTVQQYFEKGDWKFLTGFSKGSQHQGNMCLGVLRDQSVSTDFLVYTFSNSENINYIQDCVISAQSFKLLNKSLFTQ
ncbi:Ran-interacting Mog1 protein domain-containing protein [Spironucleus salmonicida]|uniref:Ran-interacting Mog1 protein domain-containing protein n=1 Tax=Spironucleus salmonicida TaxID=348837 RepID=V6M0A7_9EUKA|nr:Ran-interacting Mog1 protein domain-containing protein [Spironucleus salmonicida]|eukprot:EST49476.1 Ran-interacting Mog1 protein domain-containing protein [Spironucleus salmonicida]